VRSNGASPGRGDGVSFRHYKNDSDPAYQELNMFHRASRPGMAGRSARATALIAAALLAWPAAAQQLPPAAEQPPVSAQARSLYEQTRDSVAQIRVLLGASDTHAATGTGFIVGAGLILTNYHVVADKALEPDTYQLEFVLPDGRRGPLQIVAVDAVHDLALVKGDTGDVRALAFRDASLQKGDKGFSLGYPLNRGSPWSRASTTAAPRSSITSASTSRAPSIPA